MNTNKVLTSLFYVLISALILIFIYKVYEMRTRQAKVAQENAEFQQKLRDFGYAEPDSSGSIYSDAGDPAGTSSTITNDGIEYDNPTPVTTQPVQTPSPKTTPVKTTTSPSVTPKKNNTITDLDNEPYNASDGRYRVVAGSFTILDGARREMERLIKMWYHDAEVGKYNRGKYAVVIVKRTNSLSEANQIKSKLRQQGVDATVIDRKRK